MCAWMYVVCGGRRKKWGNIIYAKKTICFMFIMRDGWVEWFDVVCDVCVYAILWDVKAREIMTPRVVLAIADEEQCLNDFFGNKDILKFSRIPVYSEDEENITGYVFTQEVFERLAEDRHDLILRDIKREIVVVPNTIAIFTLWEALLEKKEHIALILDEYGGLDGIVTMEDIIETLLGLEIVDEKDTVTDMQKYAKDKWREKYAKYNMAYNLEKKGEEDKEGEIER